MSRPNIRSGISIDGKEVGNNEYEREGGVVKVYNDSLTLTQVWAENLEKEMDVITRFIDDEPCTVAVVKRNKNKNKAKNNIMYTCTYILFFIYRAYCSQEQSWFRWVPTRPPNSITR